MASEQAQDLLTRTRLLVATSLQALLERQGPGELPQMMGYHLGYALGPDGALPGSGGKRVRGTLSLLACEAVGGRAEQAAPAAVAVELLHGFTLLHDDIADQDAVRRGSPTVWKLWGVGQAITAGDAMYALANLALGELPALGASAETAARALGALNQATLDVCQGQHLDLAYEGRQGLPVADYLHMIGLKTAALFAAAASLGAEVGGGAPAQVEALRQFGRRLGLAFQIQDDVLGLWGRAEETGKPVGSDLLRNKRSLPILYALGLEHPVRERLAAALTAGVRNEAEAAALAAEMEAAGVRTYCEQQVHAALQQASVELEGAGLRPAPAAALRLLVDSLVGRRE